MRRTELAHQVDLADVDAEFERGGRDQRSQPPLLEALLGLQSVFARQTAVMGGHRVLAQALRQRGGRALRQTPGVHEDQRSAMFVDQLFQAVVDLAPHLVRHHRLQRRAGHLDAQVTIAHMAGVDQGAVRVAGAGQIARHGLKGFLRGGQADAHRGLRRQSREALERQGEMRPALVAGKRVDFIHDHAAHRSQHRAARLRGEQQVERFGRGDQDVRRVALHRRALRRRSIAGAYLGAYRHIRQAVLQQGVADAVQRQFEILVDVVRQGLERRDVEHLCLIRQRRVQSVAHQLIDGGEEGRQSLSRAGGRGDERGVARTDRRPGLALYFRRSVEMLAEPAGDSRMKHTEGHAQIMAGRRFDVQPGPERSGIPRLFNAPRAGACSPTNQAVNKTRSRAYPKGARARFYPGNTDYPPFSLLTSTSHFIPYQSCVLR